MSSWLHSLQLRLIIGFVSVLALALASVGFYASYATQNEIDHFQKDVAVARVSRLENVVAETYDVQLKPRMSLLEPALRNAAQLFGWKIAVVDPRGNIIAGSHRYEGELRADTFFKGPRVTRRPIVVRGRLIGEILFESSDPVPHGLLESIPFTVGSEALRVQSLSAGGSGPRAALAEPTGIEEIESIEGDSGQDQVEPQLSQLAASFNRSLIWAGLAAGAAGIVIISFTTQRTLAPVRTLTRAAGALGRGDFSMRVPVRGRDEVGELGRTFNDMATQLEDAEAIRRSMTADVAHELRTPLSNLQGYLEAIKDGLIEPDAETISSLHSQVLHLSHLVEDLRLIAMMEAGALRMDMTAGDLGDIADLTVDTFKPRAKERDIALTVSIAPDIPEVSIDQTRMRQVIANLIENAISYTPEGGRINVDVTAGPGEVALSVTDTGPGIPGDELEYVFDRMYRVDPSRDRATGGAGLGLTIVRQLVEAHGGTVSAESPVHPEGKAGGSGSGSGTRFTVRLPA
ncbi:MAG: HAMP domain-containing protein [Chloroflexi bacterium]|nr:HAMP domain-containing protein [Chloroflexota bacterium]